MFSAWTGSMRRATASSVPIRSPCRPLRPRRRHPESSRCPDTRCPNRRVTGPGQLTPNPKGTTAIMTDVTPYLASAATAELEDWGPLEEATGEPMQTAGLTLWQDGDQEVGVWECAPGPSSWKLEPHSFVHIVPAPTTLTPPPASPVD